MIIIVSIITILMRFICQTITTLPSYLFTLSVFRSITYTLYVQRVRGRSATCCSLTVLHKVAQTCEQICVFHPTGYYSSSTVLTCSRVKFVVTFFLVIERVSIFIQSTFISSKASRSSLFKALLT